MEQRSTFNRVADLYGSARPGYPDALVHDVTTFAALAPGDDVLEVGCGPGQATASFAKGGYRLLALDPGDALIRVARERLAGSPNVSFVVSPFETFESPGRPFKLVFAAQSWHWIAPAISFPKAAEMLAPDGVLAVFGHVPGDLAGPLARAFEQIYRRHTGRWDPPPERGYRPDGPLAAWFAQSGRFEPTVHKQYSWNWKHTASSFTDFARTRSDHQMMDAATREALLAEISDAITAQGDAFDWPYETHLYMARRK